MSFMHILVTGPMASGTKLLTRLVAASGEDVEHDNEHGHRPWPREPDGVVAIFRERTINMRSWYGVWNGHGLHPDNSRALIVVRWPNAFRVTYEELIVDPQGTLDCIAGAFGLEPWPCCEEVYDGNAKWAT